MFTKLHYQAIANIISRQPESVSKLVLVEEFTKVLALDNPSFNASKFMLACLKKGVVV